MESEACGLLCGGGVFLPGVHRRNYVGGEEKDGDTFEMHVGELREAKDQQSNASY